LQKERVVALHNRDPSVVEEARIAARIANGVRNGDSMAEAEMIERYSRGLGYLLTRRTGDAERARDLLQDTFCIAIGRLRSSDLDNPERLAGYLRGIAIRVAANAGRKNSKEPYSIDVDELVQVPDLQPRPDAQLSSEQLAAVVHRLLETMPVERDRELLIRLYIYDQDRSEIQEALGLDRLHLNRVLFRAKERFRKILEKHMKASNLRVTNDEK
jgi:RNA polymerase sigma-70 factor (ECF subfamily)